MGGLLVAPAQVKVGLGMGLFVLPTHPCPGHGWAQGVDDDPALVPEKGRDILKVL